jgi:transcription termination/antitermination protein NusG
VNDLTITSGSPNTLLHGGDEAGEPVHWYALRTRSRHEKKVRDRLLERNLETFLPLCERWNRWKDRTKRVELALFPGYCFARCSVSDHVRILDVPGVAEVVGINGRAEPVASREIDDIRRLIASRFRYDPHPLLEEGMEVEVVRGPLAGVRGRLIRKDRTTRLVLGVTLIHQAVVVEIHPADVARV